uniref:TRAF-type domain-containing protein n=1 Tax=Amphimedon queenslandica TaxID=400682 RepID=A0A1X7TRD7_AMPQE
MSTHLNKEKREGECQYDEVKCRYEKCQERKQRRYLKDHEDRECPYRPFQCQYCGEEGTFLSITKDHYEECRQYPVTCPNKCSSNTMPRGSLTAHINEYPLEPVDCVFSWAGCNDKPLRKDVHVHTADTKHMTLLAVACGQLKKENEQIKEENEKTKEEMTREIAIIKEETKEDIKKLTNENTILKNLLCSSIADHPLLPVEIREGSKAVHFYTSACGRHMSAKIMEVLISRNEVMVAGLLAFHEGKFDIFNPKLHMILATYNDQDIPLIIDTDANYIKVPHDILDNISFAALPQGVIVIRLGTIPTYIMRHRKLVTIYTM